VIRVAKIHAMIGDSWPSILGKLGIDESFLRPKKPGPCPICGGEDRYVFDNRFGRGDYFCRNPRCGPNDGFALLMRVFGWSFVDARDRVLDAAQIGFGGATLWPSRHSASSAYAVLASVAPLPAKVHAVLRGRCPIAECADARAYLISRGLWPLPAECSLRAHPSLEYWEPPVMIGRYPGLVVEVRDIAGELVTAHVTYLENGRKIQGHEPRKKLSKFQGRVGCAVRLMPVTDTMVIAEGIETALSAAALLNSPAWSALDAGTLAKFEPPPGLSRLVICADRDEAGLTAAAKLMERMQGRIRFELQLPKAPAKDFNDQLQMRRERLQSQTSIDSENPVW
jgi:putative DNA primase/helicase